MRRKRPVDEVIDNLAMALKIFREILGENHSYTPIINHCHILLLTETSYGPREKWNRCFPA